MASASPAASEFFCDRRPQEDWPGVSGVNCGLGSSPGGKAEQPLLPVPCAGRPGRRWVSLRAPSPAGCEAPGPSLSVPVLGEDPCSLCVAEKAPRPPLLLLLPFCHIFLSWRVDNLLPKVVWVAGAASQHRGPFRRGVHPPSSWPLHLLPLSPPCDLPGASAF